MARRFDDIRICEIAGNEYIPDSSANSHRLRRDPANRLRQATRGRDPVKRCGTGILLIRRDVFERMRPNCRTTTTPSPLRPRAPTVSPAATSGASTPCRPRTAPRSARTTAFSERWVRMLGGEIHLVYDEVIFHEGARTPSAVRPLRFALRRKGKR